MAEQPPNVCLNLPSTAENVVLIREMLSGFAEAISLHRGDLNDIQTAVTEAANNVVLHAYDGEQGPLEVEVSISSQSTLDVLVRDRGIGIPAQPDTEGVGSFGIGLHVIRTLAQRVEFGETAGGGTEARMQFATPGIRGYGPRSAGTIDIATLAVVDSHTAAAVITIAPIGLARTVLPRVVSTLAARAHFSTDRISDAQILADALVAHARAAIEGDQLSVGVSVELHDLELRIAPLGVGRAQHLICDSDVQGLGRVIEKLTDRHRVSSAERYETLTLGLIDRR